MYRMLAKLAAGNVMSAFTDQKYAPLKDVYEQKMVDLARARGIEIPTLPGPVNEHNLPRVDIKALSNMRLSGKSVPHVSHMPGADEVAEQAKKMDIPTVEKEIIKLHSPVAEDPLRQMRHRYVGGAKRFFGGALGAMKRHPYRTAAGIAGLAAAGIGVHQYLKSRRRKKEEELARQQAETPQYPSEGYDMGYSDEMYPKVGAALASSLPNTTTKKTALKSTAPQTAQKAVTPADIKMPKPSTASPIKGLGAVMGGSKGGSTKVAIDPAAAALIAGGIGGAGGYMLGKNVIAPFAQGRVKAIQDAIADQQKSMNRWDAVKTYGPAGAAAVSAIILAALAANHARKSEREKMDNMLNQEFANYDPQDMGYGPESRESPFGGYR